MRRSNSSPGATACPPARVRHEVSYPRPSGACAQFTPIPTTQAVRPLPRPKPSIRTPAHFAPRDIKSFGHLRPTSVAPRSETARARATPATKPSCAASARGQGSIVRALVCRLPLGEIQGRPRRPLPAVCSSATIHTRSVSPANARRRASSLVESTAPRRTMRQPLCALSSLEAAVKRATARRPSRRL